MPIGRKVLISIVFTFGFYCLISHARTEEYVCFESIEHEHLHGPPEMPLGGLYAQNNTSNYDNKESSLGPVRLMGDSKCSKCKWLSVRGCTATWTGVAHLSPK